METATMASWIEEVIDDNTRIKCVLNEAPVRGVASLTYWIARDTQADFGPFATMESVLEAIAQRDLVDAIDIEN